ncbi:MAG: chromate resistance protein [Anaerolineae bacterium]|nr:chromate resistance protein [Anaerolineae bacterium]
MKWITRERLRIDRTASAWLIRRFVDPAAEFLYVPREAVMTRAEAEGAIPFHVSEAELGKRGGRTGFDAILDKYAIDDPALTMLAKIVRGADRADREERAPEADGLWAVSHGFFLLDLPDAESLARQTPVFDALYTYCQDKLARASG